MSNTTTTPFPQVSNLTTVAPGATADLLGYGGILLKFGKRERQLFFNEFLTYGPIFIVLLAVSWYLLWKMRFRFDRVDAFITTSGRCKKIAEKQKWTEKDKKQNCEQHPSRTDLPLQRLRCTFNTTFVTIIGNTAANKV